MNDAEAAVWIFGMFLAAFCFVVWMGSRKP